jgi:hypothetical protein
MGIRIGVDPSWFFVLFLFIWILSSGYKDTFGPNQDDKAFALAVVSAFLFFFSVILHELGSRTSASGCSAGWQTCARTRARRARSSGSPPPGRP